MKGIKLGESNRTILIVYIKTSLKIVVVSYCELVEIFQTYRSFLQVNLNPTSVCPLSVFLVFVKSFYNLFSSILFIFVGFISRCFIAYEKTLCLRWTGFCCKTHMLSKGCLENIW